MQRIRINIRTDTITNILSPKPQTKKTYHTMKLIISTLIAAAAFISEKRTYASDRNEYYNSLFAKAGATPDAKREATSQSFNIEVSA
jgi:hypothetical protein